MKKLLLLGIVVLSGCAATQPGPAKPFCTTSQDIVVKDGSQVSSQTNIRCSDDPIEHVAIKKAGVAKNCGISTSWIHLPNGKRTKVENLVCQKFNGRWELIPQYGLYGQ